MPCLPGRGPTHRRLLGFDADDAIAGFARLQRTGNAGHGAWCRYCTHIHGPSVSAQISRRWCAHEPRNVAFPNRTGSMPEQRQQPARLIEFCACCPRQAQLRPESREKLAALTSCSGIQHQPASRCANHRQPHPGIALVGSMMVVRLARSLRPAPPRDHLQRDASSRSPPG